MYMLEGGGHSFHMKHFYVPSRIGASCAWDEGGQKKEFGQGHLIATISAAVPYQGPVSLPWLSPIHKEVAWKSLCHTLG